MFSWKKPPQLVNKCIILLLGLVTSGAWLLAPVAARADVVSGYQEYYIPGATDQMWNVFQDLDNDPDLVEANGMHEVIGVTASLQATTVYYDHWEDGYGFDPTNPAATADETYTLNQGQVQTFESSNIPVLPRGTAEFYDGRDRLYSAGGPISVTKSQWPESIGTVFAIAWEVYPVKAMEKTYTLPVGVDLAGAPYNYADFDSVYAIVQATQDNTNVQINDPATGGVEINVTISKGQTTQLYGVSKGTTIVATKPVQSQIVSGEAAAGTASKADGISLLPDDLWFTSYYSPATSGAGSDGKVDLYVYNPGTSAITVSYEDTGGTGTFSVAAKDTKSYSDGAGHLVPVGSGVYLSSTTNFWAIGTGGTESANYDFGYSLIPTNFLTDEYFLGWAPGTSQVTPTSNGSPAFVTPVNDNTTVFVDFSPTDGTPDVSYNLDRLEVQKVFDPDNVNTGMHIWATGNIAVVWGEDADTAATGSPYLDVGYTIPPSPDAWMDIVLKTDKSASPESLAFTAGQTATFTLVTTTEAYAVDSVDLRDTLPTGWTYVDDSSVITSPAGVVTSGNAADPSIAGQALNWNLNQNMTASQTLRLTFRAVTTGAAVVGYNQNNSMAIGTRFAGGQTLSPEANAFVYLSPLTIDVDTTTPSITAGGVATYTIKLTNYGVTAQTNVSLNDILPAGFTYASHSVTEAGATRTGTTNPAVGANNATFGTWTINSLGSLTITLNANVAASVAPGTYDNTARATTTQLGTIDDNGLVAGDKDTPGLLDPENDEDVVLGAAVVAAPILLADTGDSLPASLAMAIVLILGGLGLSLAPRLKRRVHATA